MNYKDGVYIPPLDNTPVNGELLKGITSNWAYDHVDAADPHTGYMLNTVAEANSMLYSVSDNTPAALAMAASRIPARLASGDIVAATGAQIIALLSGANLDVGAYDVRGATLTADGLTSGRVVFAGASGVLSDAAGFTYASTTLTVPKIGAFEAAGAINFANQNMTNVDIDSGTLDGVTITSPALRGTLDIDAVVNVSTVNGIDYTPGSDTDCDIATIAVTGTPRFYWWEVANSFKLTKSLNVEGSIITASGSLVQTDGIQTWANRATLAINLRVTSGSATHKIALQIDGNEVIAAQATGDGAGGVTGLKSILYAPMDANSNLINNVTDPSDPQDAATKNYVDGKVTVQDTQIEVDYTAVEVAATTEVNILALTAGSGAARINISGVQSADVEIRVKLEGSTVIMVTANNTKELVVKWNTSIAVTAYNTAGVPRNSCAVQIDGAYGT